jgi:electron transfer flavoprotein alpha subunit
MPKQIVVVAEIRSGQLKRATLEAVSAAHELATQAGGEVVVLALGSGLEAAVRDLGKTPARRVIAIDAPVLASYSGDGWCKAIEEQLGKLDVAAILMGHTAMGKDLMPRLSAALHTGLVTDATALHFEGGAFGATKPVFAGKAYVKTVAEKTPFMATLRPNNFEAKEGGGAEVSQASTALTAADLGAIVTEVTASATGRTPLQEAKIVVSGGRGLKGPEHFHLIEELAAAFGEGKAAVGASRAVVDAGWRPHREQVGQTGKVVAPTLYIAVGISGAIQHLAGMRTARYIVAINKDPEAPIFKVADYGIVGDVFEIVPALTAAIKQAVAG